MTEKQLNDLVGQVMANPKYANITENLVLRLSMEAIEKGFVGKSAVKYVRNKIHQIGGAYLKVKINYSKLQGELDSLPLNLSAGSVRKFCRRTMEAHASTAERLPILDTFFRTCLESIAPVTSIMDLACGLNPFSIPWMPLVENFQYFACDIYLDSLRFIQSFFNYFQLSASAKPCDLISKIPHERTQLALLLKIIPCLELMEKSITTRLIENIPADHILVSFPVYSLGGRNIGMINHYRGQFIEAMSNKSWKVQEYQFSTELAFLVTK